MLIFGLANEPKLPSLGIPVRRNGAHLLEPLDVKIERLPAVEDCLDDIRREKGKRQEPGDVGRVNRRMLGQFLDRPTRPLSEQLVPFVGPTNYGDQILIRNDKGRALPTDDDFLLHTPAFGMERDSKFIAGKRRTGLNPWIQTIPLEHHGYGPELNHNTIKDSMYGLFS